MPVSVASLARYKGSGKVSSRPFDGSGTLARPVHRSSRETARKRVHDMKDLMGRWWSPERSKWSVKEHELALRKGLCRLQ